MAYIMRGRELEPDDLDLRLKIAQLYLASGKIPEARAEVNFILEKKPQDPEAPSLLVATMTDPAEADAVRNQLLNLPAPAPSGAPVLTALALLELRLGRPAETESLLERAIAADNSFASLSSVMAALQIAKQNIPEADKAFEKAAQLSSPRSPRQIQYAQFKIRSGNPAAGVQYLEETTTRAPDYLPAWVALAEVRLSQNKLAEADTAIGKVLGRDAQHLEASILRGRLHNLRNEYEKAITTFEKLASIYPQVPVVHQELGRTYVNIGDLSKAGNSLNQALALAPNSPDAAMLLARVHSRKGDGNAAVALLRKTVDQHPNLVQAQLILADAYRSQGNFEAALAIYEKLEQLNPANPQTPMLRGAVLAQQRKNTEARVAFEKALTLNPENATALEQLVNLDLQEKKYQDAFVRIESEIAQKPKLEAFGQLLLAKVMLAQDDKLRAETYLKRVIELMPESPTGYFLLAGIYARSKQEDKALAQLAEVLARDPKQTTALMLTSVIHDQKGNYNAAKEGYEKLLALNPRSMVALNNLAYLYSERLNDLEKA
ncbi:MAG TPA: tetratricopeptide repeat protein, partial [Bacteroidia bacterium]|nr:tetratricopeptide repeat protein [Bacteroidia bacterium]